MYMGRLYFSGEKGEAVNGGGEWGRRMGEAERKGLGKEKGEQGCDRARKILIN